MLFSLPKLLCTAALLCGAAHARLTNYTLDDTSPAITYTATPLIRCAPGTCDAAWTARLFNRTSSTTNAYVVVPFTGSAVYAYLSMLGTCMFELDGVVTGAYAHSNASDADEIQPAYWTTGLPDTAHVLTIYPAQAGEVLQLDYIVYTHDAPARKVHLGAIIGGVLGGVALTAVLSLVAFFSRRHEKQRKLATRGIPLGTTGPTGRC
ncbi:hypothetical protein B0H10DRAFT_2440221 [Mycena sp. CBHHK59/15]|nr:hypothetical protein B0H10DRAFT_2440221 [Mycena sp. CBHHK59/15]